MTKQEAYEQIKRAIREAGRACTEDSERQEVADVERWAKIGALVELMQDGWELGPIEHDWRNWILADKISSGRQDAFIGSSPLAVLEDAQDSCSLRKESREVD